MAIKFVIIETPEELQAAKILRQKYIFDQAKIQDPYLWTFDSKDHVHFVLYKGVDIIGYAHLQLWLEKRAALRIIAIDEKYRSHGYGGEFLKFCEKWLKSQGYKSLHVESSPKAYSFYKKYRFIEMPFDDPDNYESDEQDIPVGKIL
jgi:GNAT superfamily N-acetyltransferase